MARQNSLHASRSSVGLSVAASLSLAALVLVPAATAQTVQPADSQALFSSWPERPEKFVNVDPMVASGPINQPVFDAFQDDPYSPGTIPPNFNGYLLYTPRVSSLGELATRMYSIRRIGGEISPNDPRGAVAQYPGMEGEGDVSEPSFSPDGRAISYKSGRLGSHSEYQIYVWDFAGKRIVKVTNYGNDLAYPNYYWSPDSRRIAYVLGADEVGDQEGEAALGITQVSDAKNIYLPGKPVVRLEGQPFFPSLSMIAWSSPQSLVFAQREPSKKGASRVSLYEASLTPSKPRKIVDDAYAPAVSPDNQWIAFLRRLPVSIKAGHVRVHKSGLPEAEEGVFFYNRTTKEEMETKIRLDRSSRYKFDEALRWAPDSSQLIVAEIYAPSPFSKNRKSTAEVQVRLVRLKSVRENGANGGTENFEVRTLPKGSVTVPNTTILKLGIKQSTRDGNYLVFDQSEIATDATNTASLKQKILVMDLQAGQIFAIAEFSPVPLNAPTMIGWDWISTPKPHGLH